jgi:F-type H+-transporting ATPase subunit delta
VRSPVVARNYAAALIEAAGREKAVDRYGDLLDVVAGVVESDPKIHSVLMSPRVTKAAKAKLFADALEGAAPPALVKFLGAVVQRGRQGMLKDISAAYRDAADIRFNRVHASVTTARQPDEALKKVIEERIARVLGTTVLAHYTTDPSVLGGVVVRVGDKAFDGSLKRRMRVLREKMLGSR